MTNPVRDLPSELRYRPKTPVNPMKKCRPALKGFGLAASAAFLVNLASCAAPELKPTAPESVPVAADAESGGGPAVVTGQAREMISILERLRDEPADQALKSDLERVLAGASYTAMFGHYNRSWRPDHLPPPAFATMVLNAGMEDWESDNGRVSSMLPHWRAALRSLEQLSQDVSAIERLVAEGMVGEAIAQAEEWLPEGQAISLAEVHFYLDGGSFPWAKAGRIGVDILQLPKQADGVTIDLVALQPLLAHEFHHIGISALWSELDTDSLSKEQQAALQFLMFVVSEGSAIKLVNNAPGGRAPALSQRPTPDFGEAHQADWVVYRAEEAEIFAAADRLLTGLLAGEISADEMNAEIRTYWLPGPPRSLGRNYYLGAELLGAIHQVSGVESVFQLLGQPGCLIAEYNEAAERLDAFADAPQFDQATADRLCAIKPPS